MNMKLIADAALAGSFAMPAFAANEFYLVQDTASKKCSEAVERLENRPINSSVSSPYRLIVSMRRLHNPKGAGD